MISKDEGIAAVVASNVYISPKQLDIFFKHKSAHVRSFAAGNANAADYQLMEALQDEDSKVRRLAASNLSATYAVVKQALFGESIMVRCFATSHPRLPKEFLSEAFSSKVDDIRTAAASNPNATGAQLRALSNADKDNYNILCSIFDNPNVPTDLLNNAIYGDSDMRFALAKSSSATRVHLEELIETSSKDKGDDVEDEIVGIAQVRLDNFEYADYKHKGLKRQDSEQSKELSRELSKK